MGKFFVLSPSSEAWDNLKDYFVREYVKCVHSRPPKGAFENQDAYWEMLLRIAASKPQIKKMIPISSSMITKSFLQKKLLQIRMRMVLLHPTKLHWPWYGSSMEREYYWVVMLLPLNCMKR